MATIRLRSVLLRSLPVLLLLLVLFAAAPRPATASRPAAHAAAATEITAEQSDTGSEHTAEAQRAPADRTTVLIAQCSTGVRGSRAPPLASA